MAESELDVHAQMLKGDEMKRDDLVILVRTLSSAKGTITSHCGCGHTSKQSVEEILTTIETLDVEGVFEIACSCGETFFTIRRVNENIFEIETPSSLEIEVEKKAPSPGRN